jgi:hypothetical protein
MVPINFVDRPACRARIEKADIFHERARVGDKHLDQLSTGIADCHHGGRAARLKRTMSRSKVAVLLDVAAAGSPIGIMQRRLERRDKGGLNINKQSASFPNQASYAYHSKHKAHGHEARTEEVSK